MRLLPAFSIAVALAALAAASPAAGQDTAPLEGEGGGFYVDLATGAFNEERHAHLLEAGGRLEGELRVGNDERKPLPVGMVLLFDYRQEPYLLDGRSEEAARFLLDPGEISRFRFEGPPCPEGRHDLFLLFFYLPDLHREDPQYRNDSRFLYHDHRMHLLCGSDSGPPALPYHTEGVTMSDERSEMRLFSLTDSSDPRRPWFLADGSAGRYFVHLNNTEEDKPLEIALVSLVDYRQVPFGEGAPVRFLRIPPSSRASLQGLIPPPGPGVHEFLLLLAESPFSEPGGGSPRDLLSSQRVLIR